MKNLLKKGLVLLSTLVLATFAFACDPMTDSSNGDSSSGGGDSSFVAKPVDGSALLFDEGMDFYTIQPSVIVSGSDKYLFYTVNSEAKGGVSSIAVRKATLTDGAWAYGEKQMILSPSEGKFDSAGVANPDVVKGNFAYAGESYSYLMAYQGYDNLNGKDNKIGFAVAKDVLGDWVKVDGIVLSSEYPTGYGVSQPSLINYDKQNKIIVFYSYDRVTYTGEALLELDASDLSNPVWGVENTLTTDGMKEGNDYVTFHDADFAYDDVSGQLYVVRNYNPANPNGCQLHSAVQVNKMELSKLLTQSAKWSIVYEKINWKQLLDENDPESMGWSYVYSGSIASDEYGYVSGATKLSIALTVTSCDQETFEYTYYQAMTECEVSV